MDRSVLVGGLGLLAVHLAFTDPTSGRLMTAAYRVAA